MKILTITSAKGGVGKTTVTKSLAVALLRLTGRPVLAIDLDPQNALALHMGVEPKELRGLARSSLTGANWSETCFIQRSGVHVLPYGQVTDEDRIELEEQIHDDPHWLTNHIQALELPDDTLVLLDTPPGPSVYGRQALSVADWTVVVTLADAASYATLPLMQRMLNTYCNNRPDFVNALFVLNQVDSARQLSKDLLRVFREEAGDHFVGVIHSDASVPEALAEGTNMLDHAPDCQASHDVMACATTIAQEMGVLSTKKMRDSALR